MAGWIALWRTILEHPDWLEPREFSRIEAWIYLIMRANYEQRHDRHVGPVDRGCLCTTTSDLASAWRWSKSRVHRQLDAWKAEHQIETIVKRRHTLIRIVNYETYQSVSAKRETIAKRSQTKIETPIYKKQVTINNTLSNESVSTPSPDDQKIPCGELKIVMLTAKEKRAVVEWYQKKGLTVADCRRAVELLEIQLTKPEYARKIKSHAACLRGWVYSALLEEKSRENRLFKAEPVRKHPPVVRADGGTIPAAISEIVNTATKRIA